MPRSASCSAGRSARTRRSSIRWPRAGCSSRPPIFCYEACERAILTHGGYGYAKEFHVERFLREVMIARIAPVSEQLILCYVAERVLGLPKSY